MTTTTTRHPDILTAAEAAEYLGLAEVCERADSARALLMRFCREGKVHPIKWTKAYLFSRADLDRFVRSEVESLAAGNGQSNETNSEGQSE